MTSNPASVMLIEYLARNASQGKQMDIILLDFSKVNHSKLRWKLHNSRVGNFIIGASGSDKQMLCASSGARAALNIAAEKSKQKR